MAIFIDALQQNRRGQIDYNLTTYETGTDRSYLAPSGNVIQKFVHPETPGERLFTGAALTLLTVGAFFLANYLGLAPLLTAGLIGAPVGTYSLLSLAAPNRQWAPGSQETPI